MDYRAKVLFYSLMTVQKRFSGKVLLMESTPQFPPRLQYDINNNLFFWFWSWLVIQAIPPIFQNFHHPIKALKIQEVGTVL